MGLTVSGIGPSLRKLKTQSFRVRVDPAGRSLTGGDYDLADLEFVMLA